MASTLAPLVTKLTVEVTGETVSARANRRNEGPFSSARRTRLSNVRVAFESNRTSSRHLGCVPEPFERREATGCGGRALAPDAPSGRVSNRHGCEGGRQGSHGRHDDVFRRTNVSAADANSSPNTLRRVGRCWIRRNPKERRT